MDISRMNKPLKKIIIVGGGTAGWLTAGIIAAEHNAQASNGVKVTLIESKNIPSIGVGEGTWPTMRETLNTLGIQEFEFIATCDASFKQGSKFIGWKNGNANDSYYHPFIAPHGLGTSNQVDYWQHKHADTSFAHALSCQPHLCDQHKAPKQFQTPEFAGVTNYGYHLDAGKFAALLTRHCTEKLGVKHIQDDVINVIGEINSNIQAIVTKEHGNLSADLFIDCSGLNSLLIEKHYKIPLVNLKDTLFNDSAVAVQVPYVDQQAPLSSHTISTAHDNGWFWDIGLPSRRGVGCVYAENYLTQSDAHQTLHQYLSKTIPAKEVDKLTFRDIKFTPGYRNILWHHNCVAVGMAAGFIEPLEASALALVELSAKMIAKELPADLSIMPITANRFNQRFNYRWERIVEFLKLHYILSDRTSTYWQDNRNIASTPNRLQELMSLWEFQPPSYNDFTEIEEIFPAASYQYILYGMNFQTQSRTTSSRFNNHLTAEKYFMENKQLTSKYLAGLPSNRELIKYLTAQYQQKIAS